MKTECHVVCGASGAIGRAVVDSLKTHHKTVIGVERSKHVEGIETRLADLSEPQQTLKALEGATHVYLCIGVPYRNVAWQTLWPRVIASVIAACVHHQAVLVFLDNVYLYGPLAQPFDEEHPQHPHTIKGKVRKEVMDQLISAQRDYKLKMVIGRSADFYGPYATNSTLYIQFMENMLKGKNPNFLGKRDVEHTWAYTLDVGRALVALANDERTYGQAWHLPVGRPIVIDEIVRILNQHGQTEYRVAYVPRMMLRLLQWVVPIIKEAKEMLYQFDYPYLMSDQKFRNHFPNFKTTSYEEGLKEMLKSFQP